MAGLTDYLEQRVLRHFFGGTSQAQPAGLFISLHTSAPTDSTTGNEVVGNGYARQTFATPTFSQAGDGRWQVTNGGVITFPVASAAWGLVTYLGIWDAVTAGNQLAYAQLTDPASGYVTPLSKQIDYGDSVRFDASTLIVAID